MSIDQASGTALDARGTATQGAGGYDFAAAQAHANAVVAASGTSFGHGMKILSRPRREAMYAVYAFCREIDDIADEGGTQEQKRADLAAWRHELDRLYDGRPSRPTSIALLKPVERYDLPKDEFLMLIEGMEMDAGGPIQGPDWETLRAYCRRVAGAVGLLSIRCFGAGAGPMACRFALSLGNALQFTNILRDVSDDVEMDRCYLPAELLEAHGLGGLSPQAILADPRLEKVCRDLGAAAWREFAEARACLTELDWRKLRPALLMMGAYEAYLRRIEAKGYDCTSSFKLPKRRKVLIALRYALFPPGTTLPGRPHIRPGAELVR